MAGIDRRQAIEHFDELIQERLALDAEEEMLKIFVIEIRSPARVSPQFHCGYMHIFISHTVLD
jgi:hypothetical protein